MTSINIKISSLAASYLCDGSWLKWLIIDVRLDPLDDIIGYVILVILEQTLQKLPGILKKAFTGLPIIVHFSTRLKQQNGINIKNASIFWYSLICFSYLRSKQNYLRVVHNGDTSQPHAKSHANDCIKICRSDIKSNYNRKSMWIELQTIMMWSKSVVRISF